MINSGIGNNDITLSVGFDYSKAIGQDAPRAAAELQKVFNNFGGKNRALIEPLGRISSSTSEFAKSLEAANARVIAFGASVGIIYNIQKAFTELVKSTVQVEKKLTDINVVLSTSSSQLRKFGDELFSIANDTGKSFEEVSNAAIEFSRQGLGVQETLKRTKDALILTRIAGIDTKDAVDALTAGVNSFSKSLIDSTQIVNKFAAVDAAFAVSSQDLAEALRRVGSSAQDAGVDLDELAGLVTSVQQTTARGGAVIGNALKTIFSRLSRGETIRELKDLGVQIDESQTGIEKLKALSVALQNVSGTQGAAIKEAAGGVYQINVVSAALGDLSKQYGIYEQALLKSRGATDEAISRNKELGTTLASLATTTENNLVKAFSKIGSLSIDTPFRSILQGINTTLLEPMGKLGDEGGSEFVTNFFKGIGKFIEGPGLTYITLVGANLTKALVGFAGDAFKQLQRYNKDNAQLLATQKGISLELERDQNLVLGIASGNIKVADAQSLIIQRLQQDLALREKIAAISKGIGQGVIKSGIAYSAETGIPQRIRKTFAGGLVPSPKEVFAESLGAMDGGYKPGKVKVTNIPGVGRAIYNDNETIKSFPGLAQPAIMPPQNSSAGQKYQRNFYGKHGFNPYMAGGNIPNFAFKSRAGSFGDVEFENKYGGGIMDIMGKTAEIGVFDTLKRGQGYSRGLYQDLFADLRNKGIKTVKGFLIPQTDNKPRENTDLSKLKALLPQIIRGRYGKSNVLSVGDKTFNIPGGKDFDNYLNTNQKSIWGAVSRGGDVDYVTYLNRGNIPNFSGLAGAIKRESQSVPASTIKVGMDSRLKSAQNPSGLGVYNTIHEPNGLSQGITRAYSEGLNPKTYNVPNFVPPSRFVRGDFGIESGAGIPANVYKQIQTDIKKNLRDLFSEFEKGSLSARKMTDKLEELKVQFNLTDSSLLKAKSAFSKFKKEVQIDKDFEDALGLTPKTVSGQFAKSQMGAIGAQRAVSAQSRVLLAGNLGMFNQIPNPDDYRQYKGLMNQFNPENYRYQVELENARSKSQSTRGEIVSNVNRSRIFNPIGQSTVFSQEVEKNRKEYYDQQRVQRKLDEIKKKQSEEELKTIKAEEFKRNELSSKVTSLRQKADSFNFFGSGRAIKEATALQKTGAITKEEVEALKGLRNNRIQTAAGLGSFLVPTVLTPALQGISDNKKYQAGVDTASSVASLGLTGLSVGATMGGNAGPIGAGIGALVGFLTTLPSLLKAVNDPLPNLLEDLQKLQESFRKSSANLQQYSVLTDKLSEVYSGAIKNVTVKQVNELETERAKTFSLLDPKVKTLLDRAGADPMRRNEIMGAVTSAQQNRLTFGESLSKIKEIKLLDEVNRESSMKAGFGGLGAYAAISTTPNYKNIEQNKKTLQDATKSLLSGLTGLKNLETGKDIFELTKENKGLQNLFGTVQSFEGLKIVLESINKDTPLDNFTEQFADFEAVIKKQPRLFEELRKAINESLGEEGIKRAINENEKFKVAEKEKNKIIDDSINKLLQFNSSLLKFSSDLQVINQKGLLDLDFKINSEKLRMNVQNTLESLNAGDYQKASIKFRENAQENIQKQDLGLFNSKIQTNQEYVEKLSEFQSNFLKSGLKDVTEINKGSPSQLREAIDSYQTRIFSFFEKAGLSNIDVKNLDKKKIDELLKNLTDKATNFAGSPSSSGPEMSGLKESELNELLKTLPELRINLEKAQRDQQARDEVIRYQFEKAGVLNTEEKRAQIGILGGANFDALTKLQNANRFDVNQTQISTDFERTQQLQKLRDEFNLSNLGGGNRLNKQFEINQRNILAQSNFESANLLPKLLQREGANNLPFYEVGTKISTKDQLDNEIKIREEKEKSQKLTDTERDILTKLKIVQSDFISGQEKIVISKQSSLELSKETLKIEKELLKYRFQEERIADNLKNIEGNIKRGDGITSRDIKSVVKEQFDYTPRDFQRDAILGVNEVSATIKTSFSGAISSIIKDGKNFGDAFREMLIGVLNKIVDKTSDITTNLLFNGISSAASSFAQGKNAGGLIKGYSTGGKVTGGSGVRDDVPAMLTDGEYVIKKSAVEAIGKANLDKINYGNDSVAFNLKNDYAYNDPKFPTSGKLDVSSALSNFGLMDTTISRTNELRLEKEQNLISYLEQKRSYDKNVGDAMRAFRQQKRNRLYGAYLSAAAGVAGAGLSSAFGPTAGSGAGAAGKSYSFGSSATGNNISSTPISSGFGYNMPPTQGGIYIGRANGGIIQRFANGGHVFGGNSITDTIPAMLTGGEYVIKKDKVNKFGKNFFDNLNNSSVRKYADGGLVSPAFAPVNTNKGINTDLTLQFNSLTNAINNLSNSIKPNTNTKDYGINNYITVSVSVDSQNGVTTESSVNSQSKGNTRNENDQNQVEKLRKGLENDMGAFINKQMKQGGTIYTFVNSRIGR